VETQALSFVYSPKSGGSDAVLAESLHEEAHRKCVIANAVTFPIACEPTVATEDPLPPAG
jgi:organic hydroperoxide reductase OsmC/OhrA